MNESFLIGERFPKVTFGTSGVRALVADQGNRMNDGLADWRNSR